jgi:poly(A) polymerase
MTAAVDPNRDFAVEVVARLNQSGFQALWAGGCVRDFLLGRLPKDYDVATNARPDEVRTLFGHKRTLAVGASFGVIVVRGPRGVADVEVATFRTEGPYLDGRRPESVRFATPEEDAKRRDFTINGMFFDPVSQQVFDYVGGEHDLGAGIIRAIGDPHDRVREDKLRMLRAVRFAANLNFALDPVTADAIREMAPQLTVVSAERIAQELRRMLTHEHRARGMQLIQEVRLLPVIFPELASLPESEWDRILRMLQLLQDPGFELAMAVLWFFVPYFQPEIEIEDLGKRLRMSNDEIAHIAWLILNQAVLDDAAYLPLARLKRLLAHPLVPDLLKLMRVDRITSDRNLRPVIFCEEYLRTIPPQIINPAPLITGQDLIDRGLKPGPKFKELLDTIRDAQLNGEIQTRAEALNLIERIKE